MTDADKSKYAKTTTLLFQLRERLSKYKGRKLKKCVKLIERCQTILTPYWEQLALRLEQRLSGNPKETL